MFTPLKKHTLKVRHELRLQVAIVTQALVFKLQVRKKLQTNNKECDINLYTVLN